MFVSCSKDSTLKVWDIKTKKLMFDLPGHSDEVSIINTYNNILRFMRLIGLRMVKKLHQEERIGY